MANALHPDVVERGGPTQYAVGDDNQFVRRIPAIHIQRGVRLGDARLLCAY